MYLKKVLLFIRISIRPFLFYIFVKLKDLQFNLFSIFPYYLKVVKSFEKFSFHILVRLACSLSFQSFKTLFSYKVTYIRFVLISTSFDVYNNNNIYSRLLFKLFLSENRKTLLFVWWPDIFRQFKYKALSTLFI